MALSSAIVSMAPTQMKCTSSVPENTTLQALFEFPRRADYSRSSRCSWWLRYCLRRCPAFTVKITILSPHGKIRFTIFQSDPIMSFLLSNCNVSNRKFFAKSMSPSFPKSELCKTHSELFLFEINTKWRYFIHSNYWQFPSLTHPNHLKRSLNATRIFFSLR